MCPEKRSPPPEAATSRQKIPLNDTLAQGLIPVNVSARKIQSNQELTADLRTRSAKMPCKNKNLRLALKVMLDHRCPHTGGAGLAAGAPMR
jgi:hypothetical protein